MTVLGWDGNVLILSQKHCRGMKMDQFSTIGQIDGKEQRGCPFSSYSFYSNILLGSKS